MDMESIILEFHQKANELVQAHADATEEEITKLGEPLADEYFRKLMDIDPLARYAQLEYMRSLVECARFELEYVVWYLENKERIPSDVEPLYADFLAMLRERGWDLPRVRKLLEELEAQIDEIDTEIRRFLVARNEQLAQMLFDDRAHDFVQKMLKKRNNIV
ncbi:hypothetical protein [Alicyclobacillus sendaiensis]|uniref:Uncharacterized protein n=1 Tax=Alicyclobacillus sendaiensis PA2 TaxID=3029425 RepID=A0ABT6Y1F7_ALISE|nr:hypothetical protein [Alicyclobacillus sendaiensis]MDI9261045.1 hypothetical protein [Alicyclobacillus sendaiensis PA2]